VVTSSLALYHEAARWASCPERLQLSNGNILRLSWSSTVSSKTLSRNFASVDGSQVRGLFEQVNLFEDNIIDFIFCLGSVATIRRHKCQKEEAAPGLIEKSQVF
jgi:hypothetical protein